MELTNFDGDLMVQILLFCDVSDLLQLLSATKLFHATVACSLSTRKSLAISCLLKVLPNRLNRNHKQQVVVARLIKVLQHSNVLQHIEFTGLRNVSGQEWLHNLKDQVALQSLNLSGCSTLKPDLLRDFVTHAVASLCDLNLNGCMRH